jgi:hypothetical protein
MKETDMRSRSRYTAAPLLWLAVAAVPAAAQPVDTVPCSTLVVDAVPENGFTIGAGQTGIEICSAGTVPEISSGFHCGWGGRTHIQKLAAQWTALSALPEVGFEFDFRLDTAGLPDAPIDPIPLPGTMPSAPIFPGATETEEELRGGPGFSDYVSQRFANNWQLLNRPTWACAVWTPENQGRFATVDRTASTPLTGCRIREAGSSIWEPCSDQDPLLRAVGLGVHAAPIAGFGTGDKVIPPITDPGYRDWIEAYYSGSPLPQEPPPGDNLFRIRITHEVPNATAVHLHSGYPGQNGPIVFDFPQVESPIDIDAILLPIETVRSLSANELYIDIHSGAYPNGALRGQLIPAQPGIFADGFESGDSSAWSATQP